MYPSSGGTSYLVEGEDHNFTCKVPDINPGASFIWTVGSQGVTPYGSKDVISADGLTTSSSMVTLFASWNNSGSILECRVSNVDGHPGISIGVILHINGKKLITFSG